VALLPGLKRRAQSALRHFRCPADRADAVAEAVAAAWTGWVALIRSGRDPEPLFGRITDYACRRVRSGRRLAGGDGVRDISSRRCQWARGFAVVAVGNWPAASPEVAEALQDNRRTPVPVQVQFRLDFPLWRATLSRRDRQLADLLAAGHGTTETATRIGVSPGRVSQKRRELHNGWLAFLGD
jgi:DNA-directed RNA polymerase specialized sigma24 family protein